MKRQERIADYDKQVNDPFWWKMQARPLFTSASALFKEYEAAVKIMGSTTSGLVPPEAEWLEIAFFMEGRGLECLLKALCAKNGVTLAANGNLRIKTHDLIRLATHAKFSLNRNEAALFRRMNKMISWGLYPVPTSFSDWRIPVRGSRGPIHPVRVVRTSDFTDCKRMETRIYGLL